MAILQSIAGFLYQVQVLATCKYDTYFFAHPLRLNKLTLYSHLVDAYLPDIGRSVGDQKMTSFTSKFVMLQFSAQALFLVLIIGLSLALKLNDVLTAQVSQGIDVVLLIIGFTIAWRIMPKVPKRHELPSGRSLITAGFVQNWKTLIGIK